MLHCEFSLDALSLRSDVIRPIKILSPTQEAKEEARCPGWTPRYSTCTTRCFTATASWGHLLPYRTGAVRFPLNPRGEGGGGCVVEDSFQAPSSLPHGLCETRENLYWTYDVGP